MNSAHLADVTYHPRIFGYLLAILILTQLEAADSYVFAWMIFLLIYPPSIDGFLRWLQVRQVVIPVMAVDALVVGLLTSLVDFNVEAGVVLFSILSVSVLIVGGFYVWTVLLPVTLLGMLFGIVIHPAGFSGTTNFYFTCFFSLVAYVCFIGALVFEETQRLNTEQKKVQLVRHRLEKFRSLISPYVSPEFISSEGDLKDCARKQLSVLFVDLEGFTTLMDTADEFLVAGMLNRYFEMMTDVAIENGGTVNKFIGDGVMVFFGDADSKGARGDAKACINAAMEMKVRFEELSGHWQVNGGEPLHLRMGVHTGYCLVGSFGCKTRRDYTALGSVVNLASRLEGLAARGEILVSAETCRLIAPWMECIDRGRMVVKGFSEPVWTFSVSGLARNCADTPDVRLLS